MKTSKPAEKKWRPIESKDALIVAFVQGAKWWEYHSRGATMWQSDQRLAEEEAKRREERQTLGRALTRS